MTRTSKTPDITLIGGGIIGLLTAREFLNAGATVALIEKNRIGQESSWAGGGILLPIYPWRQAEAISHLILHSLTRYPDLAAQLVNDTGLDPEWTPCGMLITKNPDYSRAIEWCNRHRINALSPETQSFDFLNTTANQPLWLPDIAQIRNPRLLKSLEQDVLNKGITVYEHCELTGIDYQHHRVHSIQSTQGQFAVNELVVTSGAWTGDLFQRVFANVTDNLPRIRPIKGQMLLFEAQANTLPFMVLDGDHYLIPRRDGKILVGSTVERDGFEKTTSLAAKESLSRFAFKLMPSLAEFPLIKHWAGLRPGTRQGVPYIARHPDIHNLSINAGHFRNGLVMGPASAQLLADLVLNRPPCIAPEPYQFGSKLH